MNRICSADLWQKTAFLTPPRQIDAPNCEGWASAGDELLAGGYAGVLDRCRKALRLAEIADAETMLMKAADLTEKDAAYFNLLGVLYEVRREYRLARKCYGKAIAFDHGYEPAQKNMQRLYELRTFGRTHQPVLLGDEPDARWLAQMPNGNL